MCIAMCSQLQKAQLRTTNLPQSDILRFCENAFVFKENYSCWTKITFSPVGTVFFSSRLNTVSQKRRNFFWVNIWWWSVHLRKKNSGVIRQLWEERYLIITERAWYVFTISCSSYQGPANKCPLTWLGTIKFCWWIPKTKRRKDGLCFRYSSPFVGGFEVLRQVFWFQQHSCGRKRPKYVHWQWHEIVPYGYCSFRKIWTEIRERKGAEKSVVFGEAAKKGRQ